MSEQSTKGLITGVDMTPEFREFTQLFSEACERICEDLPKQKSEKPMGSQALAPQSS